MNRSALAVLLCVVGSLVSSCRDRKAAPPKPVAPTTISRQVHAQKDRWSPHETICTLLDGNRVTIIYGRPFREDPVTHQPRQVWGGSHVVEYDKIWRMGADEATLMVTQKPIEVGGTRIPAGAYSLFMMLRSDGTAMLLVNREIGQWGIDPYHFDRELAQIPLTKTTLTERIEQFTIALEPGIPSGGVIKIMWDDLQFTVPYKVVEPSTVNGAAGISPRNASEAGVQHRRASASTAKVGESAD